jgi:hypothetical protein
MDLRTQPKSLALRACLALLIALPAVAGWCRAQSQDPVAVTLPEAVQIALARHPDVEKTRAAASQMKGRLREVRAQALPEVNFHSSPTTHVATGLRPGGRSGVSGAHGASRHRRINYFDIADPHPRAGGLHLSRQCQRQGRWLAYGPSQGPSEDGRTTSALK